VPDVRGNRSSSTSLIERKFRQLRALRVESFRAVFEGVYETPLMKNKCNMREIVS
jgi:hypothetical protein